MLLRTVLIKVAETLTVVGGGEETEEISEAEVLVGRMAEGGLCELERMCLGGFRAGKSVVLCRDGGRTWRISRDERGYELGP